MDNKIVLDGKRIKGLTEALGLNLAAFAKEIGLKNVQTLYDIRNGRHGISEAVEKLIWKRYPNISHLWWAYFDETVFTESICVTNVTEECSEPLYEIIGKMQESLSAKDRQIDELLQIIKLLQHGSTPLKEDGI